MLSTWIFQSREGISEGKRERERERAGQDGVCRKIQSGGFDAYQRDRNDLKVWELTKS